MKKGKFVKEVGKFSSVWMLLWVISLYYFTLLCLTNLGAPEPLMVVDASKGFYVFVGLSILLLVINFFSKKDIIWFLSIALYLCIVVFLSLANIYLVNKSDIVNYPNHAAYFYIIGLVIFFALIHAKLTKKMYIDKIIILISVLIAIFSILLSFICYYSFLPLASYKLASFIFFICGVFSVSMINEIIKKNIKE